jgi:hypothetical protein
VDGGPAVGDRLRPRGPDCTVRPWRSAGCPGRAG